MLNILKETLHYQLLHVIFIIIIIICIIITFVTVITLEKYRSPHEFYLVPLMQPWRKCYIMSHCTCNAIIFNTLTTRQFLFFYWQSTIRMIDYNAELLTQLHMVYHSSL